MTSIEERLANRRTPESSSDHEHPAVAPCFGEESLSLRKAAKRRHTIAVGASPQNPEIARERGLREIDVRSAPVRLFDQSLDVGGRHVQRDTRPHASLEHANGLRLPVHVDADRPDSLRSPPNARPLSGH